MGKVKVYVFEDDTLDRAGLLSLIDSSEEMICVGTSDKLVAAVEDCRRLGPDLVIADGQIDGNNEEGGRFVKALRKEFPVLPVLGLTRIRESEPFLRAAGCTQVINKAYLENQVNFLNYLLDVVRRDSYVEELGDFVHPNLTEEEMEVLKLLSEANSEKKIAKKMEIGLRRVKYLKNNLCNKLGAQNALELIYIATKHKIIP